MTKHNLAIGTIFRDETRWLPEWLHYHRQRGVEHFFLLCNDDEAERAKVATLLAPYVAADIVTWAPFESRSPTWQAEGWEKLLNRWGDRCVWIALIDVDEFLYPVQRDSVAEVVAFGSMTRDTAVLGVHSVAFGDSGLVDSPELQIEAFTRRAPLADPINYVMKFVVNPSRTEPATVKGGYVIPRPGFFLRDTSGADRTDHIKAKDRRGGPLDVLRLHHYAVRSKRDWARKVLRGWPDAVRTWKDQYHKFEDHKYKLLNRNDEYDNAMGRFVPELRRALRLPHGSPP